MVSAIDASVSLERQQLTFNKVYNLVSHDYEFKTKEDARDYFIRLTGLFKNFNYAAEESPDFNDLLHQIHELAIKHHSKGG